MLLRYRLFLVFLIVLFPVLILGQEPTPLVTETYVTKNDSVFRNVYIYNNENQINLETSYVEKNNIWQRIGQTEWIYINGLLERQYIKEYKNAEWFIKHQIDYIYNNDLLTSETHSFYSEDNILTPQLKSVWEYTGKILLEKSDYIWENNDWLLNLNTNYTYKNSENESDTVLVTLYNEGIPQKRDRIITSYNANSQPTVDILQEKNSEEWINSLQTTTDYNPTTQQKNYQLTRVWDNENNKWVDSQSILYSYDDLGKTIAETYREWKSPYWINSLKYDYLYDENSTLVKLTTSELVYKNFRPVNSITYTDFKYGKASLIQAQDEFWGGDTGTPINTFIPFQLNNDNTFKFGSKVEINYLPVDISGSNTTTLTNNSKTIFVYPNPSKDIFYFNVSDYKATGWTVSDISGKNILLKSKSENSGVIDLGNFKQGIYILKLYTKNKILSQKLIKL